MTIHTTTQQARNSVVQACHNFGDRAIIALAGVPGTGKSYIAEQAAHTVAGDPLRVTSIQFHPSYSYEEFIEGVRPHPTLGLAIHRGLLLDLNDSARSDPGSTYVLLIDELTRADLPVVLGELLTGIEYRERDFLPLYSRMPVALQPNLVIIGTYNPVDRNAIGMDHALLRRMRVLPFTPSLSQLEEMLTGQLPHGALEQLKTMFRACSQQLPDDFAHLMPFGHGVFAMVNSEADLYPLWHEVLVNLLRRPLEDPNPFYEVIREHYPWQADESYRHPGAQSAGPLAPEQGPSTAAGEASDQASSDQGESPP